MDIDLRNSNQRPEFSDDLLLFQSAIIFNAELATGKAVVRGRSTYKKKPGIWTGLFPI